jgi:hypothetical protein
MSNIETIVDNFESLDCQIMTPDDVESILEAWGIKENAEVHIYVS